MTDEQLATYTEPAARIACAVKDRDQVEADAVWAELGDDVQAHRAVIVLLAALVPDDVRMGPILEAAS